MVSSNESSGAITRARSIVREGPGTVVVWEDLDRVLPERYAESGWGRRRLTNLARKTSEHLSIVFHRFLDGSEGAPEVVISVNGEKLRSWDPFARTPREQATVKALRAKGTDVDVSIRPRKEWARLYEQKQLATT